ncbi:MAG: type IV toxin-antitoxin system AbiEi family antitoxin [Actinobacteria bacterium]|nr:type IV toxin-antitoxin system AbiEi family antitoxin [Actinomycetota bacterium]
MNDTMRKASDRPAAPKDLADWLLARGQHWVTTPEVADLFEMPTNQVWAAAARLVKKNQLFSPTRGAYVPIPPEFRFWGAVPASHFIDALMKHLGHDYYVGYLSAAEVHGSAHQRPQVFQVLTSARLKDRTFGRVRIEFTSSAHLSRRPVVSVNNPTGVMKVSSPEVTVFDLVASPQHGGGLSNIATVIAELLDTNRLSNSALAEIAGLYSVAVRQRVGWLFDSVLSHISSEFDLSALAQTINGRVEPTPLDASGQRAGHLDDRWNILVNTDVEPDL